MDSSLKQRLVGAVVITALAAIFIPMMVDDSVDQSTPEAKQDNLQIPPQPQEFANEDNPIPKNPQQVLQDAAEDVAAQAADNSAAADEDVTNAAGNGQELLENEGQAPDASEAADGSQDTDDSEEAVEEAPAPAMKTPPMPKSATGSTAATPTAPAKKPKVLPAPVAQSVKEKLQHAAQAPAKKTAETAKTVKNPELQRWVVQLGSFSKKDNADALVSKLRSQGFNAYGDAIPVQGKGTLYRVRIGPELDRKRAQATQNKVQQMNALNGILLSE